MVCSVVVRKFFFSRPFVLTGGNVNCGLTNLHFTNYPNFKWLSQDFNLVLIFILCCRICGFADSVAGDFSKSGSKTSTILVVRETSLFLPFLTVDRKSKLQFLIKKISARSQKESSLSHKESSLSQEKSLPSRKMSPPSQKRSPQSQKCHCCA